MMEDPQYYLSLEEKKRNAGFNSFSLKRHLETVYDLMHYSMQTDLSWVSLSMLFSIFCLVLWKSEAFLKESRL